MASSTSRMPRPVGDENMEHRSPGKANSRVTGPLVDSSKRSILKDLTPNTSMSSRQPGGGVQKSMSLSPLKRSSRDVLGDDKGLKYLKRRRLSHGQAVNNASLFRQEKGQGRVPMSPPPSSRAASGPKSHRNVTENGTSVEKESDEDSGRESQNSNNTRGSFSSLINYDPSSQQALASQALSYVNVPPSVPAHSTPVRYSASLTQSVRAQAQLLKMRLKIAIYKVRTNQIHVPFSQLRLPEPQIPAPRPHAHPLPSPTISLRDDSPPSPARAQPSTHDQELPYGLGLLSAPDMTPNVYSNRFMPLQRAPSSSPPFIRLPSSLPRHAMTRDTTLMAHTPHDHDSLDSEATELADDMHDAAEGMHAESPSRMRRAMFSTPLPR